MTIARIRLIVPTLIGLALIGCSTVCTKPDPLYESNSLQCARFCADPGCAYWGQSKMDAEQKLAIATRDSNSLDAGDAAVCRSKGLSPDTAGMRACLMTQRQQRALDKAAHDARQNASEATFYLEK
ncbi:MAG: hypothetical protein ACK443_11930 [Methylococcaceae bacterium]|jgi:hypothetical protein